MTLGLMICLLFVALLAGGVSLLVSSLPGAADASGSDQVSGKDPISTGPPISIDDGEIVAVEGIRVHDSIATNLSLLLDHARADGLNLEGWGYRPTSRQIELRIKHCGGTSHYAIYEKSASSCSPPTARPGKSQHERGLAVDFKDCSSRATVCYRWLARNAATYGLKNLPSEAWHWSTTGR